MEELQGYKSKDDKNERFAIRMLFASVVVYIGAHMLIASL